METMIQSLNWSNDLEIDEPRRRGFVRLRTGDLLFILTGAPQVGGVAALIGVASLPCAAWKC